MVPSFVSFDNGVCRRANHVEIADPLPALKAACENVQLGANMLDEQYRVIAQCRRVASAGGFVAYEVTQ